MYSNVWFVCTIYYTYNCFCVWAVGVCVCDNTPFLRRPAAIVSFSKWIKRLCKETDK